MIPAGTRLFVADLTSATVTTFDISGGAPLAGANTPLPAGATNPVALAVNPAGTRLFVANDPTANVTMFDISSGAPKGGANTALPATATAPSALALK